MANTTVTVNLVAGDSFVAPRACAPSPSHPNFAIIDLTATAALVCDDAATLRALASVITQAADLIDAARARGGAK